MIYGLAGICWGPFPSATTTLLQIATPRAALSSVLAARAAVQTFALPLGALTAGPLVDAAGPMPTITVSCLLILSLAVAFAAQGRTIGGAAEQPSPVLAASS